MSALELLAVTSLFLAAIPAWMTAVNLCVFHPPRSARRHPATAKLSVLIPARNEESAIGDCVAAVLATEGVDFECVVLDDASEDRTAEIVASLAADDPRVRLVRGSGPPAGWNGKQYACFKLAEAAGHDLFCWIDADVRVAPDCFARLVAERKRRSLDLLSGLPRQVTGTWLEHLLIPLIHVVLLGYLPLPAARFFNWSAFAAGCGQCFLTTREAYEKAGTHAAVKSSRHDGVTLPRTYRRAGLRTDLVDLTPLASCRMYRSAGEVWAGLSKNATEGLASPVGVFVWTILLGGGFVLPWCLPVVVDPGSPGKLNTIMSCHYLAVATGIFIRWVLSIRFRQNFATVLLSPVGVTLLLSLQWSAWLRDRFGKPVGWKGRPAVESDIRYK